MELVEAFEASEFLKGISPNSFEGEFRNYRIGERITDEPRGRRCVGLLVEGHADVIMTAPDGNEIVINTLYPGGCFGVSNLMNERKMESTLLARSEVTLFFISKAEIINKLSEDAHFSLQYATFLNNRVDFLLRQIELLTIASARGKLSAYLLLHRVQGERVVLSGSRDELADRLGISRAALFRELYAFQEQGILKKEKAGFSILRPELLELYFKTKERKTK